jgi:uncharacterized protein YcbX
VTVLGRVLEVWRYPVKSLRGERVERAELSERGIPFDRAWGVVDPASGKVLSAKREARLLEGASRLDGDVAVLELPDGEWRADDPAVHAALSAWLGRDVRLAPADADEQRSYEMNVSAEDEGSPTVDFPCPPGTFFDAAVLHVLTTSSLRAIAAGRPASAWDVRRFRPTVLVDTDGDEFLEDDWVGQSLRIGGAQAMFFAPTVRCVMTTRAQADLPRDLEVVKTINRSHQSNLGAYGIVQAPGPVSVGDEVALD